MTAKGEHYRHEKRKSRYEVVGLASLQNATERKLVEGDSLVIYRDADGDLWARHDEEFSDGRFKKMDVPVPTRTDTYAIKIGDSWHIAYAVSSLEYSANKDYPVWSEQGTTALLGNVGEEAERILLAHNA